MLAGARPCGRFAPSPTGPLHFGSLVAAVASYADARAAGGLWVVRIEDVDEPRTVAGAEHAILRQSARTALYAQALDRLAAQDLLYECACSRRDLAAAPVRHGEHVYPGTCRAGIARGRARAPRHSLRVRVPDECIAFVDRLQGPQSQTLPHDVGDFVVRRADGLYAYQLAVVVDDAAQGVSSVVGGGGRGGGAARPRGGPTGRAPASGG